ncbi:YbhB/YbcL family Raf kinase inhibitor-like protein [Paenibacillus aurantiacus]|uniref:YbhB/YbcL family Raf kinase inhibitor-like protein n=1 Tax=Paenibacillus aurantiacus TaxID=1936118 RepID=A0ABV5KNB1_9BACL
MSIRKWAARAALMTTICLAVGTTETAVVEAKERNVMNNVAGYMQWNSPITIEVDGKVLPVQGQMENARLLIPVRAAFEAIGAKVDWDAKSGKVRARRQDAAVEAQEGRSSVSIQGRPVDVDHPTAVIGGQMMVAARVLPDAFGIDYTWDLSSGKLSLRTQADPLKTLRVSSSAYANYGPIPGKYAHQAAEGAEDLSLPLAWAGAPSTTKSFAVIMYDPHPIADNWIHWSVLGLPASTTSLQEGASGKIATEEQPNPYFGMGPPPFSGDHPYRIEVYALDTEKLELPDSPLFAEDLIPVLKKHALAYGVLNGYYGAY